MKHDIFISYRREGGFETAKHLYDLLIRDNYSVSFDIDTLRSGDFDIQLYSRIDECTDFVLIVNDNAFERALAQDADPRKDWLRCELSYALLKKKNIIPILLPGASLPENLPNDIKDITLKNGPLYNNVYFDAFYQDLVKRFILSKPRRSLIKVLVVAIIALTLISLSIFTVKSCFSFSQNNERLTEKRDSSTTKQDSSKVTIRYKTFVEDGHRFEGRCINNIIDGTGIYYWPDSSYYVGHWVNGKRWGHGIKVYPNGKYEILYYENERIVDRTIQNNDTFDNGFGIYAGETRNGEACGRGTFCWPDGWRFEGTWTEDGRNRYGVLYYPNSKKPAFIGNYTNERENGYGCDISEDGKITIGFWSNGEYLYKSRFQ